ncbi:MAG: DUF2080 family transposase-associated protein [Nanoarchaeota archaeon]|nr:DUF2080 family transposase-associated protein [Nanoarchaeota archaeon]
MPQDWGVCFWGCFGGTYKMKIIIEEAIEMIETEVKSYKTSTRISVPKRWAHKRVKVILINSRRIRS